MLQGSAEESETVGERGAIRAAVAAAVEFQHNGDSAALAGEHGVRNVAAGVGIVDGDGEAER